MLPRKVQQTGRSARASARGKTRLGIPNTSTRSTRSSSINSTRSRRSSSITPTRSPPSSSKSSSSRALQTESQQSQNLKRKRSKPNEQYLFKCDDCGESLKNLYHLEMHRNKDCRPYKCDVCESRFQRKIHLKRHVDGNEHFFVCNDVNFGLKDGFRLRRRIATNPRLPNRKSSIPSPIVSKKNTGAKTTLRKYLRISRKEHQAKGTRAKNQRLQLSKPKVGNGTLVAQSTSPKEENQLLEESIALKRYIVQFRPFKNVSPTIGIEEVPIRRKRGRPRKYFKPERQVDYSLLERSHNLKRCCIALERLSIEKIAEFLNKTDELETKEKDVVNTIVGESKLDDPATFTKDCELLSEELFKIDETGIKDCEILSEELFKIDKTESKTVDAKFVDVSQSKYLRSETMDATIIAENIDLTVGNEKTDVTNIQTSFQGILELQNQSSQATPVYPTNDEQVTTHNASDLSFKTCLDYDNTNTSDRSNSAEKDFNQANPSSSHSLQSSDATCMGSSSKCDQNETLVPCITNDIGNAIPNDHISVPDCLLSPSTSDSYFEGQNSYPETLPEQNGSLYETSDTEQPAIQNVASESKLATKISVKTDEDRLALFLAWIRYTELRDKEAPNSPYFKSSF